jgi:hypothetical protein
MAVAYIKSDLLILYAITDELLPHKKQRFGANNRAWALIGFNNLAEDVVKQENVQRWTMAVEMRPAVQKYLNKVGAVYEELTENECLVRAKLVIDGINTTLNQALNELEQRDREAGLT